MLFLPTEEDNKVSFVPFVKSTAYILVCKQAINSNLLDRNEPCQHLGPCNDAAECACFLNHAHCERNCACGTSCNKTRFSETRQGNSFGSIGRRRWRGCHCHGERPRVYGFGRIPSGTSFPACATNHCPCVKALRECDPELCLRCECKYVTPRTCTYD